MKHNSKKLPVLNKTGLSKICDLVLSISLLFILSGCSNQAELTAKTENADSSTKSDQIRIITIGGSVTETAYALGAKDLIVATDTSSLYPVEATKLPQVGYQRRLSAEGVLSQKPSHIIATSEAGPPPAMKQIKSAGIKVTTIENDSTVEGAKQQIRKIAEILNLKDKGEELVKKMDEDLAEAQKCVDSIEDKPKVLFIYARGSGTANVSGTKTEADAMIKLAGGENAMTEFEGFKPLTSEGLVSASPDIILMPQRGLETIGGQEGLLKLAGVSETPAGKNKRIITVEDLLLLGFSPRLGIAVNELCQKLR